MKRSSEESTSQLTTRGKKNNTSKKSRSEKLPDSDDLVDDVTQENAAETLSQVARKSRYDEYFHFSVVNEVKTGMCKICDEQNKKVEIRMVKCNTSGLVNHLINVHKSIYELLFPRGRQSKGQQTRQVETKVSQ